jgi:hypothetical protein
LAPRHHSGPIPVLATFGQQPTLQPNLLYLKNQLDLRIGQGLIEYGTCHFIILYTVGVIVVQLLIIQKHIFVVEHIVGHVVLADDEDPEDALLLHHLEVVPFDVGVRDQQFTGGLLDVVYF